MADANTYGTKPCPYGTNPLGRRESVRPDALLYCMAHGHNSLAMAHLTLANCSLAAATMCSTVKPNFFCNSFSGAEAPKVCMPMV